VSDEANPGPGPPPLEDALDLVIRLRGSDKLPSDADLVKLRKNIEEALSAFEDLWERSGLLDAFR
jgi:hypothetical protein